MPTIILSFLLLFLPAYGYSQKKHSDWSLKKFENGISVYTRDIENSNFKELRSTVQLKTSLSSVVALLNDWDTYPQWVYRCSESKTLKKYNDTELIHYQTVTAPWPVDNRDFVVRVKITQDEKTKVVCQKAVAQSNFIKPVKDYVRIIEFTALWTLTPLENGLVNIEYQLLVNPGGNVPAWLVNLAVVDGPFETSANIKIWVMKEKYQKASLTFIKEP